MAHLLTLATVTLKAIFATKLASGLSPWSGEITKISWEWQGCDLAVSKMYLRHYVFRVSLRLVDPMEWWSTSKGQIHGGGVRFGDGSS